MADSQAWIASLHEYRFAPSAASGKYRCEPSWYWQPNPLTDYDVWYVVAGQGSVSLNGNSHKVGPGSCYVFQPGDRIVAEHNPERPLVVFFCHFGVRDGSGSEIVISLPSSEAPVVFRDTSVIEPLLQQLIELSHLQSADDAAETDLLIKLILVKWMREAARIEDHGNAYYQKQIIVKVQGAIRYQLSEPVDYEALGKGVGLTPRHISKLMKTYTGLTLKETISKLRMERAVYLLTETAMSVTEVAGSLGYADIYTFSKLFKRHYGIAPTASRNAGGRRS